VAPHPTLETLTADPHPVWHALREAGPVARVDALDAWVVLTREACLRVMRDDGGFTVDDPRFSTSRITGPSMLSLDGPAHARHRAPFARRFRLDAVRDGLGPFVRAETARLLDAFAPEVQSRDGRPGGQIATGPPGGGRAPEAELRSQFAGPLAAAVMVHALGLERDVAEVLEWYAAIVRAVDEAEPDRPVDPAGTAAFAELAAAIGPELAEAGDALTREEAVANAAVLLFGGIDTTEGMLLNAVWHLFEAPEVLAAVRADPALLPGVVEESLRLEPAAGRIDRYATADVELGGAAIRKGDLVVISITAANRDPAVFPDPDRFDPQRPDVRRHLAFAAGPHVCLGMHLARLEAHTALGMLLGRFPDLAPAEATAPRGLVFRKPPSLRVRL